MTTAEKTKKVVSLRELVKINNCLMKHLVTLKRDFYTRQAELDTQIYELSNKKHKMWLEFLSADEKLAEYTASQKRIEKKIADLTSRDEETAKLKAKIIALKKRIAEAEAVLTEI